MDENRPANDQELIDVLIAISVVARRLARKLEILEKEKKHGQNERTDADAGCPYRVR
jgi:hypothetical protein